MIRWQDPNLSSYIAGAYLGLLTLLWLGMVWGIRRWGERWRLRPEEARRPGLPRVAVCVPARDEARNIARCVRAVLASRHRDLELIVVDDRSTDGTAELALEAAGGDPRFRLLRGREPPPGWSGKAWALNRAAADAGADRLLFLDADVELHPDALGAALARLEERRLDLLSLFGSWRLETFWERVIVPVVGWLIRGAVDLDAVNDPVRPDAFANGQFILVRRDAYEAVGGHGAVREQVLDDVGLARAFAHASRRIGLFHAPWAFRVRLYAGFREAVDGYTKNLYEGMGRSPLVALGLVLFVLVGTLAPFLILLGAGLARLAWGWVLLDPPWVAWLLLLCGLVFLFRFRLERMEGRSGWHALSHPLGAALLVYITLRSMSRVEVEWKGRLFRDGRAVGGTGGERPGSGG